MSWDIFVLKFPSDAKTLDEVPKDYIPPVIASRTEIIDRIKKVIPTADFGDPVYGSIELPGCSMHYWRLNLRGIRP